jgi:hypothetical protein
MIGRAMETQPPVFLAKSAQSRQKKKDAPNAVEKSV